MLVNLRYFGFSLFTTVVVLGLIFALLGPGALFVALVLMAIEVAFSFDNAIINAKILATLSDFWRKIFLTVGILIAIFGMRVLFPLAIVSLTGHLSLGRTLDLALNHPKQYAHELEQSRASILAFGGAFLTMLTVHFFTSSGSKTLWIQTIERPLRRLKNWWVPSAITLIVVGAISLLPHNHHSAQTIQAGISGVVAYSLMQLILQAVGRLKGSTSGGQSVGMAAFVTFMYLELLDASFSFDGVIGAFALTNDVVLIAAGLGVGAVWVRSLTVFMVRQGTLKAYKYLEHGAHYAIGTLAAAMLVSIVWEVPELVTGVTSLGLIVSSVVASRQAIKQG